MGTQDSGEAELGYGPHRRRLEAQVASDRYLDPSTGLPRLSTLCHALSLRADGPPVAVVLVTIDGYEELVRRRGHMVGERCRRQLGAALRTLVAAERADVAAGAPGRFVVVGPETDGRVGSLAGVVGDLAATVGLGLTDPPPAIRVATGRAASAADAARALLLEVETAPPARAQVLPFCEPVVATRSGRLRGLRVRPSADRVPDDTRWTPDVVAAAAREIGGWPQRLARAVGTVWVDVPGSAAASARLLRTVRDDWLARRLPTRLGLRVRPDGEAGLEDVPALRELAAEGVRCALVGLSTGLPDPTAVDRTVFRELVVDPGLVAGATTGPDDAALAWGLVAFAARHGMLTTADGVDDAGRLRVAAELGAWHVQGAVFGPMVPLFGALDAWRPEVDLRPRTEVGRGGAPAAGTRVGRRSAGTLSTELTQWAASLDDADTGARARVSRWLDEATTPAHVRRLLAAERYGRRWTLAEASLLVALAAG